MKIISLPRSCPICEEPMTFEFNDEEWFYYCCTCDFEGKHHRITKDLFVRIEYKKCIWQGTFKKLLALPEGKLPPCRVGGTNREYENREWRKRDPKGYAEFMEIMKGN